jgi:cytochrome c oxidase cbb3-type subunit 3
MSGNREIDQVSGVDTTGHEWDGIKELNNPLPRWWLWTLYATIIWSVGYMVVYPAIPGLSPGAGASKGIWGWSSRADVRNELSAADAAKQAMTDKIAGMDINAIMADNDARTFAVSAGASLFKVNCVQCHGSGAQGGPGFPNLNDDSWMWGGKPEQVVQTIAGGVRDTTSAETRDSLMPAFGKDGILDAEKIGQVTNHVRQLANLEHDAAAATAGATVFAENCASCHGEKGEGNQDLGAPQLNDAIWLYGDSPEAITAQVNAPRHGMMPGWKAKLGDAKVKQLAAYVLSLGGGQ